ncbi:hypothetical protein BC940DRAFT_75261 [Gongronella butleri]|nr:hypothetical protein BC940DRAFT_75261 [Gongronella butleri]
MTPPKEEIPLTNSRKRKLSGTPEEPRRPKRSSLVCSSPIDLEKLIGDATQDHDGDDTPTLSPPPPTKRKELRKSKHAAASGSPMAHPASSSPLSRQAVLKQASPAPSDEDERPQVMSIHFLCNDDETKRAVAPIPHASYQPPQDFSSSSPSSSISHSPLDLLCDAVLGTEYIQTHTKQEVAAAPPTSLTVVVPPVQEIKTELDHKAFPLLDHPDSAVGLSPLMERAVKKPLTDDEDDDDDGRPLIKREKEEDTDEDDTTSHSDMRAKGNSNQGNNDDDFLDDVSDLSSVCSSDSDLDDDKDQVITPPTHPGESANVNANANAKEAILIDKPPRGSPNHHHSHSMAAATAGGGLRKRDNHHGHVDNHEPCCVICDRPLKQDQKITDTSAAADVQVANELATWTWSPSAAFTDWNPQRCPRCERHSRVFGQEWPNRHPMPPSSSSSSSSSSSIAPTPTLNAKARRRAVRKQHGPQQHLRKASLTKSYLRSPPSPTSAIFDGVSSIF